MTYLVGMQRVLRCFFHPRGLCWRLQIIDKLLDICWTCGGACESMKTLMEIPGVRVMPLVHNRFLSLAHNYGGARLPTWWQAERSLAAALYGRIAFFVDLDARQDSVVLMLCVNHCGAVLIFQRIHFLCADFNHFDGFW
jgi:hypothetical protein